MSHLSGRHARIVELGPIFLLSCHFVVFVCWAPHSTNPLSENGVGGGGGGVAAPAAADQGGVRLPAALPCLVRSDRDNDRVDRVMGRRASRLFYCDPAAGRYRNRHAIQGQCVFLRSQGTGLQGDVERGQGKQEREREGHQKLRSIQCSKNQRMKLAKTAK